MRKYPTENEEDKSPPTFPYISVGDNYLKNNGRHVAYNPPPIPVITLPIRNKYKLSTIKIDDPTNRHASHKIIAICNLLI